MELADETVLLSESANVLCGGFATMA